MKNPLISVIVPVYNMEKYLSYCVESLLHQTYSNLEILLIDDGSTDKSLTLCQQYAVTDSRCKVFHQKNSGVGTARNLGLRNAQGEYISFVDSDDYVDVNFIEVLYHSLISGDYDFSIIDYKSTLKHDCKCTCSKKKQRTFTQLDLMNCLYNRPSMKQEHWDEILFIIVCNKLYRKSFLKDLFFSESPLAEDLEFNNQVFLRAQKAVLVCDKMYFYYQKSDSAIHRPIDKNYIHNLLSMKRCLDKIPLKKKNFRAVCLIKLYKLLFLTRFLMRHLNQMKDVDEIIENIGDQSLKEFILNKNIPVYLKSLFIIFYKMPVSYRLFMGICELKAKIYKRI